MTRYEPINQELYIGNRQRLCTHLKPKSLVVLNANDILPTNADGTMVFKQNTDLFYLTGIDQEETIMVLCPNHPDEKYREVLFLRETNEHIAVWEGDKLTKEQGRQVSGIQRIYWTHQFESIFRLIVFEADHIYLNTNEHTRNDSLTETRERRFIDKFRNQYPLHSLERLAPLMHSLREIKQRLEIAQLNRAMDITRDGFVRILKFVKPGVGEYEIEAEFLHEFVRQRSKGFAYTPIIASGANACVLHYIENSRTCKDGDVLLLDVAAEYGNYNADMTRSIPVNGRFTQRQRDVYEAVLRVMRAATAMLVTGNLWDEYHIEVGKIMESELLFLGLITKHDIAKQDPEWPAYRKYLPHGTSHFLGLDVHDVGNKYHKMAPGMVFTCEPGIYIPQEGLGIRLENNILITETGNVNLMAHIPIEADEIETIMNSH
jgi:Xaa-Pro aminopeptidase